MRAPRKDKSLAVLRGLGTFTVGARDIDIRNLARPLDQSIAKSMEEAGRERLADRRREGLGKPGVQESG